MHPRHAVLGLLIVPALIAVAAGPAAAQNGGYDPMPWTSTVIRDSPLYADTPDGWACHFLGPCRPDSSRLDTDPAPIAELVRGQTVQFICVFGTYSKVATPDDALVGWMPSADLRAPYTNRPDTCSLPEWNGWWA